MKKLFLLAFLAIPCLAFAASEDHYSPAFGEKVAQDCIADTCWPKMKMAFGAAGNATEVSATNPLPFNVPGRTSITQVRNAYASVNVGTSTWVQLVASTTDTINQLEIFDSSGQTLEIGVGAAASEIVKLIVFPGGNGSVSLLIPASSRVAIKALSGTANTGELDVNFYK